MREAPPPPRARGCTIAAAVGKAATPMLAGFSGQWDDVLTVCPEGYSGSSSGVRGFAAGHPLPNEQSVEAGRQLLGVAATLDEHDQLILLLSGGASAALCAPVPGLSLARKQAVTRRLLESGLPIEDINCVRRHLSQVKGGRLAAFAWPARTYAYVISDVDGDDLATIGSGPTVGDPSTVAQARALMSQIGWYEELPWSESIKPGDARLERSKAIIVLRPNDLLESAERELAAAGYHVRRIGDRETGDAVATARRHAEAARDAFRENRKIALLSGGELTVTVRGSGLGGPNQEYALAMADELRGLWGFVALAADSDGRDGVSGAAGGVVDGGTAARAEAAGAMIKECLADNDSWRALSLSGDVLEMQPTGNNLNDLRMILIDPARC